MIALTSDNGDAWTARAPKVRLRSWKDHAAGRVNLTLARDVERTVGDRDRDHDDTGLD